MSCETCKKRWGRKFFWWRVKWKICSWFTTKRKRETEEILRLTINHAERFQALENELAAVTDRLETVLMIFAGKQF